MLWFEECNGVYDYNDKYDYDIHNRRQAGN